MEENLYICKIENYSNRIMSDKKLPIGVQNFESLRKDGYFYVDKTSHVYNLVNRGRYYFLSRPRRFGKSLLLSTIEAYMQGKKELFEGFAIYELEKEWVKHPIFHLDLNSQKYDTPESLEYVLEDALAYWESLYGANESEKSFSLRFQGVIRRACEKTGQRVVILVDEYDKPMLQAIGNEELQKAFRNTLKPFYGCLKSMDGYIKLGFLTGVTKFGKVSVFSDLNNLDDISMDERYIDICGISEQELQHHFREDIEELGAKLKLSYEDTCNILKEQYDGYHFCEDSIGMYNPFSLLNTFKKNKLGSYWFETGTPTYLVELLQLHNYSLEKMSQIETDEDVLNCVDSSSTDPIPVIYQSGYLTIKDYDPVFGLYKLGFPNKEVEDGFLKFLMPYYTSKNKVDSPFEIRNFVSEILTGNYEGFLRRLQSFFADTTYEQIPDMEIYYGNVLFIVFKLAGMYVKSEYHTSNGRADLVMQTDKYIYVMEFKLDQSAETALQQINEKQYALPFITDTRKLFKIGVNFSSAKRNIDRWIVEE